MKYEYAREIQEVAEEISGFLFPHIKIERIKCFKSFGSSSKGTIARCHTIGKLMQETIGVGAFYGLEFLSEQFDQLSREEQIKTIIHELMHIPKSFGGGFRHHDWVCEKNVNKYYAAYKKKKDENRRDDVFDIEQFKRKNFVNLRFLKEFRIGG